MMNYGRIFKQYFEENTHHDEYLLGDSSWQDMTTRDLQLAFDWSNFADFFNFSVELISELHRISVNHNETKKWIRELNPLEVVHIKAICFYWYPLIYTDIIENKVYKSLSEYM